MKRNNPLIRAVLRMSTTRLRETARYFGLDYHGQRKRAIALAIARRFQENLEVSELRELRLGSQ